jgi:hypothetical protein
LTFAISCNSTASGLSASASSSVTENPAPAGSGGGGGRGRIEPALASLSCQPRCIATRSDAHCETVATPKSSYYSSRQTRRRTKSV